MLDSRMHKVFYDRHRQRVENAKSEVRHKAPIVHAGNFVAFSKLRDDQAVFSALQSKQFGILKTINQFVRTQGSINTFEACLAAHFTRSRVMSLINRLKDIEKANEELAQKILNAKPEIVTRHTKKLITPRRSSPNKTVCKKKPPKFVIPENILKKYDDGVNIPKDENILHKLLRPKIFIEVEVHGTRPLGQIVIELYTEACPDVVLEFVRACQTQNMEGIRLVRSFPKLWLEGELDLKNSKLGTSDIEYDMRALDHGTSVGIMSLPHVNLKGFPKGFIPFTISYKPLRVANGNRLAFGKVISGLKNLFSLQDYGTKNGKPSREMKIKNCGTLPT